MEETQILVAMLESFYSKKAIISTLLSVAISCMVVASAALAGSAAGDAPAPSVDLPQGYGYLLVNLNVDGVAPSFNIIRLGTKRRVKEIAIEFGRQTNAMQLYVLRRGEYQITRVNAPYFDLPYRLNTADDPAWRFTVEAGKVNYLGKLVIGKERSSRSVKIDLVNQVARDLEDIKKHYAAHLESYPLVSAVNYRDDFLVELKSKVSGE